MFVRIVYDDGREVLRDCEEATISQLSGDDSDQEAILISVNESFPGAAQITYVVPKYSAAVYFMNNMGRTIDSYQWGDPVATVESVGDK